MLVGGVARTRNDSDHEELFRQESYFQHLFGVKEPGWVGTVEVPSGVRAPCSLQMSLNPHRLHVCGVFVTLDRERDVLSLDAVVAAVEVYAYASSRDHVSHRMGKMATSELANSGVKVKWLSELQTIVSQSARPERPELGLWKED